MGDSIIIIWHTVITTINMICALLYTIEYMNDVPGDQPVMSHINPIPLILHTPYKGPNMS